MLKSRIVVSMMSNRLFRRVAAVAACIYFTIAVIAFSLGFWLEETEDESEEWLPA